MSAATNLTESAMVFVRELMSPATKRQRLQPLMALPLYMPEIQQITEPSYVTAKLLDFFLWPEQDDPARAKLALTLDRRLQRLDFSQHCGTHAAIKQLGSISKLQISSRNATYTGRQQEHLYNEMDKATRRAEARKSDFYPLVAYQSVIKAADLLRHLNRYDTLLRAAEQDGSVAYAYAAGYHDSLFRASAKILLADRGRTSIS